MFNLRAFPFWGSEFSGFNPHPFKDFAAECGKRHKGQKRNTSRPLGLVFVPVLAGCFLFALAGCGANYTVTSAGIGSFQASTSSVEFGSVTVGQTANSSFTLVNQGSTDIQVSALKMTGNDFNVSNTTTLPISVSANGGTYTVPLQFQPKASGDSTGQLMVTSTSSSSPSLKIKLHGKGTAQSSGGSTGPVLSSFSCAQNSITGAGSDACTVSLSAAPGTGGVAVSLSSNNTAVTVPSTVTVAAGATSAGFTATVAAVTSAQSATLGASAGGTNQTFTIGLGASVSGSPGSPALQLSTTSLSFGSVVLNTSSASQSVTLTSSGTAPLTINSASLSGAGFRVSGMSFPATLNPGQTASLTVVFTPTTTGTASGSITLSDNASPSSATITLSGTGQTAAGLLSGVTCSQGSFTGAGSDACTVSLSAAAGTGGLSVSLSSSNSAVTVPGSVTVPAGAASAGFTATVTSVTTAQSATLTAAAGGISKTYAISLGAAVPALTLSASSLNFGGVALNTTSTQSITLTSSGTAALIINSATLSGTGFSMSGASFPVTLNPGQTATLTVSFKPTASGSASGSISLSDNANPSSATVSLSGSGQAAAGVLSGVTCSQGTMTGAGSDACTVSLSAAAGTGGLAVTLSSSSSAVTVPGSVTVPAGATSAAFTASVTSVTTAQSATITAAAGGVTKTYAISLGAALPTLTISASSVSFGNVNLNTPATQSVILTSSGTAPLTVSAGSVTGSGFSTSGLTFPLTLNPGQTATLYVQFDPTTAGAASGTITLTSNSSSGNAATIGLSGTGTTVSYQVDLTWSAPTNSTDPVAGYNVYRATGTSTSYQNLNSTVNVPTTYNDLTVQSGTSYSYYVESVDAQGTQSNPSNTYTVSIP